MTDTRHLSYAWMKRGGEYETFLVLCAAQDSSPTDHPSFLPESPRPVVDRTITYPPALTTLGPECCHLLSAQYQFFCLPQNNTCLPENSVVLFLADGNCTTHTREGRHDGTHQQERSRDHQYYHRSQNEPKPPV